MMYRYWLAVITRLFILIVTSVFLHRSLAEAKSPQTPLHIAHQDESRQTFTLSHVFYHPVQDQLQQPASFIPVSELPHIKNAGISNWPSTGKSIKVRNTTNYESPAGLPVENSETKSGGTFMIPVITDKDTVINLAMMTSDSYLFNSSESGWLNLTQGFDDWFSFGYDGDGLRGHIFSNFDNSTVIIAFKGTSVVPYDKTRTKDRLNDNMLFSWCCATQRPDPYWYGAVCSCRQDVYQCNATCLTSEITQEDRYYAVASSIVQNVTENLYPSATVWMTGHSLGGSLASLMGLRFGLPAVTFEAPPDRLPARRIGLISSNSSASQPIAPPAYHFGNNADPIYMGACNKVFSICAAAGYAFESQCFTGKRCIYDTMGDKGWHLSVRNHRINNVIDNILKAYDDVPECVDEDDECIDCFNWYFN